MSKKRQYRMLRQTNYLMKHGPHFVQYIVQKRTGLKWTSIFQHVNETKAIEFYGTVTQDWPREVRYKMKMKEHMAIVNSDPHSDMGGLIVTEEARMQHKAEFKKAIRQAMAETAGQKDPWAPPKKTVRDLLAELLQLRIDRIKQKSNNRKKQLKSMGIDEDRVIAARRLEMTHTELQKGLDRLLNQKTPK